MILIFRRAIILVLFVLQSFAPLVHAHAHIVDCDEGVHIHGIISADNHEHQLSALDLNSCTNTAIAMHSAILKKKLLHADICYINDTGFSQPPVCVAKEIDFLPPGISVKPFLLLSDTIPRAPPV